MSSPEPHAAWRQGSILSEADVRVLFEQTSTPIQWRPEDVYIVISHSCDVARASEIEPVVEVVRAVAVKTTDGNFTFGKSSRNFDFGHPPANGAFRISIGDRTDISKSLLSSPASQLDDATTDQLARWVSRRYRRAAFPDEFNSRLRSARKKIRKALAKRGGQISLLLIWVYLEDELAPSDDYEIEILATLRVDEFADLEIRNACVGLLDEVAQHFSSCAGIEVMDHAVRSEQDVSLADLHYFSPWDVEDLSHRGDDAAFGPDS